MTSFIVFHAVLAQTDRWCAAVKMPATVENANPTVYEVRELARRRGPPSGVVRDDVALKATGDVGLTGSTDDGAQRDPIDELEVFGKHVSQRLTFWCTVFFGLFVCFVLVWWIRCAASKTNKKKDQSSQQTIKKDRARWSDLCCDCQCVFFVVVVFFICTLLFSCASSRRYPLLSFLHCFSLFFLSLFFIEGGGYLGWIGAMGLCRRR